MQGGCLAAEVQWTSHLPSRLLFHHIWCRVVQSASERGQDKLAEHMKTELLRKEDQDMAGFCHRNDTTDFHDGEK